MLPLKLVGGERAFAVQLGDPSADPLPLACDRIRAEEQGEMAACSCSRDDLFARCPDQLERTEELFGRCNLVRLTREKAHRDPDHLEVRQAAERFKAALRQLVLPKELGASGAPCFEAGALRISQPANASTVATDLLHMGFLSSDCDQAKPNSAQNA